MSKIYIIGIGYKPIEKKARAIILGSDIILASGRLFDAFTMYDEFEAVKDKVKVINKVDQTMDFIRAEMANHRIPSQIITLLASGDPMFFGIGRRAVNEFGKDTVEIIPDLSCIQLAFSKIKETWDDALLMSLHGGPDPAKRRRLEYELKDLPLLLSKHSKIAILTDRENNPTSIARHILSSPHFDHRPAALKMYVCEKLSYADEELKEGTPQDIASMSFSEPNVVIIQNMDIPKKNEKNNVKRDICFGLTEKEILHSRGLITKDEVRAVVIHKLRLPHYGVLWDVGAGSGSVSVEVSRVQPGLRVFSVEKDEEQLKNLNENKLRFNATNIEVIKGSAPEVLKDLPPPDRVFIGGSGGNLEKIVSSIAGTLYSGVVVIAAVTLETLQSAIQLLQNKGFDVDISEVSISRFKMTAGKQHIHALNPVFVIRGEIRR
ncbi:MAG: precorrin-6y C5,15-methyltransferase (decarboxylating) subunit CbiE [Dissulfurispiraceae bacterium]